MARGWLSRRQAVHVTSGAALVAVGFSVTASRERTVDAPAEAVLTESTVVTAAPAAAAASRVNAGLGPEWDLPNLDHPRIDYWVNRFQTVPEMREKFQGFLDRGSTLAPHILERLRARGMPQDLLYLAMIESGFQVNATSHAAAVGVWQFIRETGERYGLEVDRAVDERRDPIRATEAALDYLSDLHDRFGSWYLAAAAYNSGEGRVSRAMRAEFGRERARSEQDYYRIWNRLPRETRDYVPLMIAAARITKDPEAYGFRPMEPQPMEWDQETFPPATQLSEIASLYGTTVSELKKLNPHFRLNRTPNDRDYTVRLPAGSVARYAQSGAASSSVAD